MSVLGWTRGGRKQDKERIEALERAVEALDIGVRGLDTAVETLERGEKKIRLEWEDVYDRITRTMGRLNARIRKAEATEPDAANDPKGEAPDIRPTGTHAILDAFRKGRR